jgi:hypothetical protein
LEALELIPETLGNIHDELAALREITDAVGATYRRPNADQSNR